MAGFWNTYFELLQFIEIIYITNICNQYVICLSFIPFVRLFMRNIQTAVSPHPLKIGYMFIWTYLLGTVHTTTWNALYIPVHVGLGFVSALKTLRVQTQQRYTHTHIRSTRGQGKYYFLVFKWICSWLYRALNFIASLDTPVQTQRRIFDRLLTETWQPM